MITFSFSKILEFFRLKNWGFIKENSSHVSFAPAFEFDGGDNNPNDFVAFLPKSNIEVSDVISIWQVLSKFYTIPFYELALIHFAENPTVLTLAEYVSQFSHGVKEYADFLDQTLDVSQMSDLFKGIDTETINGKCVISMPYIEVKFGLGCYKVTTLANLMILPLPKTVEHFVTDLLRIVGEKKRLKFKQK